jgi:uncharacterized membrane protein YdfJ with MMPL/SSD domain
MRSSQEHIENCNGLSRIGAVVVLAVVTILAAVLLPPFHNVKNSWALRPGIHGETTGRSALNVAAQHYGTADTAGTRRPPHGRLRPLICEIECCF